MKMTLETRDRTICVEQDVDCDDTVDTVLELLEAVYVAAGFKNDLSIEVYRPIFGVQEYYIKPGK